MPVLPKILPLRIPEILAVLSYARRVTNALRNAESEKP
jgi:hypothetical protein